MPASFSIGGRLASAWRSARGPDTSSAASPRECSLMAAAGSAIGLAGALAFGRVIEGLLFQIKATDPFSIAIPLLLLAAAAVLATLAPALRAVRIDPAQTLRNS